MTIKNTDFIEITYTGKLKEDGSLFDTTDEKTAKENDMYNPDAKYGPIIICVGEKHVLKGIDDFLIGKDIGKHKIDVSVEDGFGKKDAKLVQLIPLKKFTEHGIRPSPGLAVNVDGMMGVVKTASGGRILVDFNHPLAGKELEYDLEVKRIVEDKKEQIQSILSITLSLKPEDSEISIEGDSCKIKIKKKFPEQISKLIEEKVKELVKIAKVDVILE